MGLFRKLTSVSTLGMVDFRSDKERIAKYTKKGYKAQRAGNAIAAQQLAAQQRTAQSPAFLPPAVPARPVFTSEPVGKGAVESAEFPASRRYELLVEAAALRDAGTLTEAEFETMKRSLLTEKSQ